MTRAEFHAWREKIDAVQGVISRLRSIVSPHSILTRDASLLRSQNHFDELRDWLDGNWCHSRPDIWSWPMAIVTEFAVGSLRSYGEIILIPLAPGCLANRPFPRKEDYETN